MSYLVNFHQQGDLAEHKGLGLLSSSDNVSAEELVICLPSTILSHPVSFTPLPARLVVSHTGKPALSVNFVDSFSKEKYLL